MEFYTSLLSPITEIFPELGLSYFLPPCNTDKYDDVVVFKVGIALLVWGIILNKLYTLDKVNTSYIAISLLISFSSRLYKNFHHKYNFLSFFHTIGFVLIYNILNKPHEKNKNQYIHIYIFFILIGGFLIGYGRENSNKIDIFGRAIFSIGFTLFSSKVFSISNEETKNAIILIGIMIGIVLYKLYTSNKFVYIDKNKNISNANFILHQKFLDNKYKLGSCDSSLYMIVQNKKLVEYSKKYNHKIFFNVPKNYLISNKHYLWKTLKKHNMDNIIPHTYLLPNELDKYKSICKSKLLIFKNNEHQQKGLELSNECKSDKDTRLYIVAQEYIKSPYLYKGYKINLRMYLIVKSNSNGINAYISNDGIVSYTKEKYDKNNPLNPNSNISSFYDSKQLYNKGFPITINQLTNQLNETSFYNKCKKVTTDLVHSYKKEMVSYKYKDNTFFEIFGVDYFVDENQNILILEVNSGPGMTPHNKIDEEMRNNVFKEYFSIITNGKTTYDNLV